MIALITISLLSSDVYWVFFNDKGPVSRSDYDAAWAQLSPKAQQRRLKHGFTVGFGDLPVYQGYVDRILSTGAEFMGSSRWLNAAAFRLNETQLQSISAMEFVRETRPARPMAHPDVKVLSPKSPQWDTTDYGLAFDQEAMMQVPWAHQQGYDGSGVLIGFLDTGFHIEPGDRHHALDSIDVVATWDFINSDTVVWNQAGDDPEQDFHGSICLTTVAGYYPGEFIGVAPRAQFALAKTEDVTQEVPQEEVWYVQGLEWLESLGCDLTSSSLGYIDWYDYSNLDGDQATTTVAVDSAAARGLLCITAMGNSGPAPGSLIAPADADSCISVGAVDSDSVVTDFSSRGPTYDGRTKPELAAQGNTTYSIDPYSTGSYGYYGGTSLATPLIAGAAALLIQAKPGLSNMEIRELLMNTASNASSPNNDIGWGVPNLMDAIGTGVGETRARTPVKGLLGQDGVFVWIFASNPGQLRVFDPMGRLVKSVGVVQGKQKIDLSHIGSGVFALVGPGVRANVVIR